MSADNGIYILRTKDGQCRVKNICAIENLNYSEKTGWSNEPIPERIFEMFDGEYTRDINKARDIAFSMARKSIVCEYGVNEIIVNKTWKQIVREAIQT